jgi:hypothetical protein
MGKNTIKITHSDIVKIARRVISEQQEFEKQPESQDGFDTENIQQNDNSSEYSQLNQDGDDNSGEITFKFNYTNRFDFKKPLDVESLGKRLANSLNDANIVIGGNAVTNFEFVPKAPSLE